MDFFFSIVTFAKQLKVGGKEIIYYLYQSFFKKFKFFFEKFKKF
jgi:hypothetical protein